MKKWVVEDWAFELTAVEGKAENCRLGIAEESRTRVGYIVHGLAP